MKLLKLLSIILLLLAILLNCKSNKAGKILNISIPAPSLSNNRIDEPLNQPAVIYLPPSYDKLGKKFPVVYFLPGFDTPLIAYTSGFFQGFILKDSMNDLIKTKKIKEMIVVMINGRNKLGGSFYVNSPATGNWENFIVNDVVNYIDENYKTIKKSDSRGISGQSMGGVGALNIAMKHPDVFCVVYSLSPGLFDETGLKDALLSWEQEPKIHNAYGAAFSPDLNIEPPYAEIPKNDKEPSWSRWENGFGNLKKKISDYKKNLLLLKGITIDVGYNDEYEWIIRGSRFFSKELISVGISNYLVEYDGRHINKTRERIENHLLPYFSTMLKF